MHLDRELERDGFRELGISVAHAQALRDPFDRMLVAQAKVEGLTIMTADDAIFRYGVPVDARL